jgi:hypothetical protein
MFAGRKKECEVWKFFQYRTDIGKSVCLAINEEGVECGVNLAGKNPTNLKVSLSCFYYLNLWYSSWQLLIAMPGILIILTEPLCCYDGVIT